MFSFTKSFTTRDPRIFLELNITAVYRLLPRQIFQISYLRQRVKFLGNVGNVEMISMSAMTTSPIETLTRER